MIPTPAVAVTRSQIADFVELSKPRIVLMVLLTTMVGFYLGTTGALDLTLLCNTVVGTALAAAGALALNQFIERDLDARMDRTRRRPLPEGRIDPTAALGFGVLTTALGLVYLTLATNALAGLTTAVIVVTYLFAYTPLKRRTSLCSVVGAVPGALPPLAGFVAARGAVSLEGWVLFAIMFLWQIPHSLAIARLYRDDYARAGMRLLPVIDPDGASTGQQVVINSLALLAVALIPTLIGLAGGVYFMAALTLGLGLLGYAVALALWQRVSDARRLLFASLVYLPLLLIFMVFDKATV